jgi:hypothetical protein
MYGPKESTLCTFQPANAHSHAPTLMRFVPFWEFQIGINYRGQHNELRGCVNDARNVRRFLIRMSLLVEQTIPFVSEQTWHLISIERHGFRNEDIVLLTDDTTERRHLPTRQNMLDAMKWLVRSARPHDSLFFHCTFPLFLFSSSASDDFRFWPWWPSRRPRWR